MVLKSRLRSAAAFVQRYERTIKSFNFLPGDLVLARNNRVEAELDRKAKPRYLGPYMVVRRTRGGAYILCELDGSILATRFAAFRVIPFHARERVEEPVSAIVGVPDTELDRLASQTDKDDLETNGRDLTDSDSESI